MTEARRTPAEREALRVQVIAERRRRQRSRWMLAGASAGAVTSASLLGLVSVAWWNGQHQPAPRPQAILERRIVTTTRVVRPRPRVKVIRVVRAAPQSGMTFASSASTASSPTQAAATAPAYVQPSSGYSAPAAPSAPPAQTHVQTVTPSAPPPPPVTTHAS
jgi:hypothetical protein